MRLAPLLIGVAFLDELASGIAFVGSPEIKSEFGVSYAQAAGWLLFAITALGFLLEPPLFLLSDRLPRRWFVCGGLALLGVVCVAAGLAPSYGLLVAALQYPIAKAQAYRALPNRSGAVNAVLTLFGAIELPLPIAIGVLADHSGLGVALATLALQPIGLAVVVLSSRRAHATR